MKIIKNKIMLATMLMFAKPSLYGVPAPVITGGQQAVATASQTAQAAVQSMYAAGNKWWNNPLAESDSVGVLTSNIISPNVLSSTSKYLEQPLSDSSVSSSSSVSPYVLPTLATASIVASVLGYPTTRAYVQRAWSGVSGMFKPTSMLRMLPINSAGNVSGFKLDNNQNLTDYVNALNLFGFKSDENLTREDIKARYVTLAKRMLPDVVGSIEPIQDLNTAYEVLKESPAFQRLRANIASQMSHTQALKEFGFQSDAKLSKKEIDLRYEQLMSKSRGNQKVIKTIQNAYEILKVSKDYQNKEQYGATMHARPSAMSYATALKEFGFKPDMELSEQKIKDRYLKLVKKHHPDRGGSDQEMQKIIEAYNVLKTNDIDKKQEIKVDTKPKVKTDKQKSAKVVAKQTVKYAKKSVDKVDKKQTTNSQRTMSYENAQKEFGFKVKDKPLKKDIEMRYKKLSQQYHGNKKTMNNLNTAYKILKNGR